MRGRVTKEFKNIENKYAKMNRLRQLRNEHGDLSNRLQKPKDREDYAELLRLLEEDKEGALHEFQNNSILRGFREAVKERLGYEISVDESQLQPEKIQVR